jgi:hypothetical protein
MGGAHTMLLPLHYFSIDEEAAKHLQHMDRGSRNRRNAQAGRLWWALAALVIAGCTPSHNFTAITSGVYEPYPAEHEIQILDEMPDTTYVVLGYVESRGTSMGMAMPYLIELAREHGGDAIVGIESETINEWVFIYRGKLIRYTP